MAELDEDDLPDTSIPFFTYFKDNWKALTLFGTGFIVFATWAIFKIPVEFFYSRINFDPLYYYFKGYSLAKLHTTHVKLAENIPDLLFIGWPGYLRLPIFYLTDRFDQCLRVIQFSNIILASVICWLYSYHFGRIIPKRFTWLGITLSFYMLLFTNFWPNNITLPYGDIFFVLISLITIQLMRGWAGDAHHPHINIPKLIAILILMIIATMIKFTGIFLAVFMITGRQATSNRLSPRTRWLLGASGLLMGVIGIALGHQVLQAYITTWIKFFMVDRSVALSYWCLNFICITLPAQIIPNLGYAFPGGGNTRILLWDNPHPFRMWAFLGLGLSTSLVIFWGVWKTKKKLRSEIWYFLLGLPIYIPIATGTIRYLSYSQIFIWLFFLSGCLALVKGAGRYCPNIHSYLNYAVPVSGVALAGFLFLRIAISANTHGTKSSHYLSLFTETAEVYRGLNTYLQGCPTESTRLVLFPNEQPRWKAIRGLIYYLPDAEFASVVKKRDVLLVIDATRNSDELGYDTLEKDILAAANPHGAYSIQLKFHMENSLAKASVFSVKNPL